MALGDLVQVGETVAVGFDSLVYGTMLMRVASREPFSEETPIKDERGATVTLIEQDPGDALRLEGVLLAADLTAFKALDIGSVVTINALKYRVTSATINYQTAETTGVLECRAEDSLTDTGGPLAP